MAIHFDTQGPAPDGFHVPLSSEWTTIKDYMDVILEGAIGDIGTNFSKFLKLPFAGKKYRNNGNVGEKTTLANYWSSTYSGNTVSIFYMTSTTIYPNDGEYSSAGLSIRPFKDSPVAPVGEGWVKITAGSYSSDALWYNESLGLFSLTRRNLPTITIADKNVGATTVWNYGNTLSEENCGKYYQWGNNYGFSRNGGGTTSSTQVDASSYGPGNYYESDTFITRASDGWDSSVNRNLWGGVSQGTWETPDPMKLHGHIGTWHMESIKDYSAMQGPCPDGFHVPLVDEWVALYDAGISIGAWTSTGISNFMSFLKMPKTGWRSRSSSNTTNQGYNANYWSSTRYNNSYAYRLAFESDRIFPRGYESRALGHNIRCFKDVPVVPDNSWTTLYDGSSVVTGAGIFYSSALGFISISGDGINWITIADKNLGATTVWNSGDTLTDANCGYFYQWGNNYGFPYSGTVTASSTQVDASNYGPGNYYSSSTFITVSSSPYRWDTTDNGNLRGGVTGVVTHYIPRS